MPNPLTDRYADLIRGDRERRTREVEERERREREEREREREIIPPTPPAPPTPQPFTGQMYNIPQMPDISGLHPHIDPGLVRDLWSTFHQRKEYQTPEYISWLSDPANVTTKYTTDEYGMPIFHEAYPKAEGTLWQPSMDRLGYEEAPLAHAQQIFKWSPAQIQEVWGALGWGSPTGTPTLDPDRPNIPETPFNPCDDPSYRAAYPEQCGGERATPTTPELQGIQHTGGGVGAIQPTQQFAQPSYGKVNEWLDMLKQPITADVGLGERERQGIYNLARGQVQGATKTAAEQMREAMGGRGFRAGESGVADTAIGNILRGGQQTMADVSQGIGISELQNRFAQNMALNQANLQRMGLGGQMALGGRGQDVTMRGQDITQQLGLGGLDLGYAGLDVQKELGLGQLGLGQEQLGWQKEMFGQTFPYQQEMDALSMLMNLYGMQQQSQQWRWNPYWQSLLG